MRAVRGGSFATSAVVLAATAHLLGGGRLPTVSTLVALIAPTALVATALSARLRGPVAITAATGALQAGLHEAIELITGMTGCPTATPGGAVRHLAGPSHHPAALHCAGAQMTFQMARWHVLATVLTALLLAYGERLLVRLAGAILPRVPASHGGGILSGSRLFALVPRPVPVPVVARGGTCRRGPPA
jgi:hypothetical protein